MNKCSHKILLIEDDAFFRETTKEILENNNFEVLEAPNGEAGKAMLKDDGYDAIISDIQMPEMDGVELTQWVRSTYDKSFKGHHELPIILITGFAHIIETQKVHDLGVQEFLIKPFRDEELIKALKKVLNIPLSEETKDDKQNNDFDMSKGEAPNFCRVSLEDFVTDREIQMDVYVQLSEKKFIKIAHQGGKIDLERIENYKKKGLRFLYVRQEDFKKVLDFNVMLSKVVSHTSQVDAEKKKRFVANTAGIIMENVAMNGIDEHAFNSAKNFFSSSFDVLTEDKETFNLLEILSEHSDHLYAHSLGVSIYSVMIAKQMGWNSTASLFKLQFGALMHDIGKKEFPPELVDKPRSQLTFRERQLLESHAFRSKEILESLKSAPAEVVAIAYEHHENMLGQGFPRKVTKEKIHPMAKIVSVANEFCNYALKDPNNPGMSARKAYHLLQSYKEDQLDPTAVKALGELIKKE